MSGARVLRELEEKKREVEQELRAMEDHIYEMETAYLTNTQSFGNVVKGYEPLLTQKTGPATPARKPGQKPFRDSERVFTLSSLTNSHLLRADDDDDASARPPTLGKRKGKDSKAEPTPRKKQKRKSEEDSDFSEGARG